MHIRRVGLLLLSLALSFGFTLTATPESQAATTYTVCSSGCNYTTIADAISAASAGDTISIQDAVHNEWGITVDRNLTIEGQGAANTAVDGNGNGSVFIVGSNITATIQDLTIEGGDADNGGGINNASNYNGGNLTVSNCIIRGNSATNEGGGIYNFAGNLTVNDSAISANTANLGGGIVSVGSPGNLTINNSTISNNSAASGGGIYDLVTTLTVSRSSISDNSVTSLYGGVYSYVANTTVSNSNISGNSAGNEYGGICISSGSLALSDSVVSGNSAPNDAGIFVQTNHVSTIDNSTISDNHASGSFGGIANWYNSELTISNSTISGNSAHGYAGMVNFGTLLVGNSTISGNLATSEYGGIVNSGSLLNISNSTIADNSAVNFGGIWVSTNWPTTVKNSIVANNSGGDCGGGLPVAQGDNLDADGSCGTTNFTQVTSAELNLGPLALNAPGSTATHTLLAGSAAIDAVSDYTDTSGNQVASDQRGVLRPQGAACDIGAFEAVADSTPPAITITAPIATTYTLNQAVQADYSCTDTDDTVTVCAGPVASSSNIDTSSLGTKNFTVDASDSHGNSSGKNVAYTVGYGICVLYDQNKAVKSGAAVPVKLQLCDANGANLSSADISLHSTGVIMVSTDTSKDLEDAGNSNPDADFRFDSSLGGSGGYIFNLKTTGYASGTYALQFTAGSDPTLHTTQFQVR